MLTSILTVLMILSWIMAAAVSASSIAYGSYIKKNSIKTDSDGGRSDIGAAVLTVYTAVFFSVIYYFV